MFRFELKRVEEMKMFKRKMSIALALVMVLTALFSMPIIQANAAAIVATDATVVCADAPAGMNLSLIHI